MRIRKRIPYPIIFESTADNSSTVSAELLRYGFNSPVNLLSPGTEVIETPWGPCERSPLMQRGVRQVTNINVLYKVEGAQIPIARFFFASKDEDVWEHQVYSGHIHCVHGQVLVIPSLRAILSSTTNRTNCQRTPRWTSSRNPHGSRATFS